MQKLLREYLDELNRKQKRRRKTAIAAVLAAIMLVSGVIWNLTQYGIAMTDEPKCGMEEHIHSDSCYADVLICGQEESAGHTHTDACYQTTSELACGQEESEEHTHSDSCYQTGQTLNCGQEESEGHTHTEACYERQLVCGKEEHTHSEACYIDTTADVEDASVWDAQYAKTEWKDAWGEDLVIAAGKQIDYKESTDNYTVAEDGSHKGYTRYGQFAGDVYADWDAIFVNFCMHYAGLEVTSLFPGETETAKWHDKFAAGANGDYLTVPAGYEPQAGDIVFFQKENEETDDQMGIISSYNKEKNEIKVIEGNSDNKVKENKYTADDKHITAYLKISELETAYKNGETKTGEEEQPGGEAEEANLGKCVMTAEGADYTVTVSFTEEAGIPEDAVLDVREIERGSDEYQKYYEQSLEAVGADDFRFARYFDITFLVDGKKIEPKTSVDVKISYPDDAAIDAEKGGKAVHFADNGTEVLDAEVSAEEKAFKFTQESFSVTGTTVTEDQELYYLTNIADADELDGEEFLVTNVADDKSSILSANSREVKSVTFDGDSTVTTDATAWKFQKNGDYYTLYDSNNDRYLSVASDNSIETTTDADSAQLMVSVQDGKVQISSEESEYVSNNSGDWTSQAKSQDLTLYTADASRAAYQYVVLNPYNIAKDGNSTLAYRFNIDGTIGSNSNNRRLKISVASNSDSVAKITLPSDDTRKNGFGLNSYDSSNSHYIKDVNGYYKWKLIGWYNIATGEYYDVSNGPKEVNVDLNKANVFYAHWGAADDELNNGKSTGVLGGHYSTVDTSGFATIEMFDYDELFNLQQVALTQEGLEREKWGFKSDDQDPITFYSTQSGHLMNKIPVYPDLAGVGNLNNYGKGKIKTESDSLLQRLFNTGADINQADGVRYLGSANYLFYKDGTYYEYDSAKHAAFYNLAEKRFYVYKNPQKWKTDNDATIFLPLNEEKDQASKDTCTSGDKIDYAKTNYWFGMKTELNFWLPDDSGGSGANLNNNNPMIFEFSGDDDVWVFVDGKLALDLSGIHAKESGSINFSTGVVTTNGKETNETFSAGGHKLTVYYMERGRGGSNCKIRFNLLPAWNYEGEAAQDVTVEKKWEDSNGTDITDKISNESIKVELKKVTESGATVENTQELNSENSWKHSWKYLDKDQKYEVTEDLTGISDSYVTTVSNPVTENRTYWVESSSLGDGDIIIIGNGQPNLLSGRLLIAEGNSIEAQNAEFANNGDILKDDTKIPDSCKWEVEIVQKEEQEGIQKNTQEGHIQFRLKNKNTGQYLNIKEKEKGVQLVGADEASILTFSEKGNLTGTSLNRLVCATKNNQVTPGFEIVTKQDTERDKVDPNTGQGSYRRVHIYKQETVSGAHTTYTITNKKIEANITLEKVNKNAPNGELLEGAEFALYSDAELSDLIKTLTDADKDGNKDGKIEIGMLEVGTYWLKETKAPEGYQLLEKPIKITVSKNTNPAEGKETVGIVEIDYNGIDDWNIGPVSNESGAVTIKVPNMMLYSLPEAGGPGIYWYIFSGILLMAGAMLIIYKNKCKEVLKS